MIPALPALFVALCYISMIVMVLVLDDGLDFFIDLFETIFHDIRYAVKRGVNTAIRVARMTLYGAIALLALYGIVFIGWVVSLITEFTFGVIALSITLTLIATIFFVVFNWITAVAKRPGPSVLATVTLIPIPIAFWAAVFPFHFYEWFLAAYGLFLLVGFGLLILGRLIRSKVFLGPYAISGILIISSLLAIFVYAFPQQARAMVIDRKISNRDSGRESLAKEIALRPIDKFKVPEGGKAYWWRHTTDSAGRDKFTRYLGANGNQCYSVNDEAFKTVLVPADSVEMGGTYIQAYFPDQETGEYIFLDVKPGATVKLGGKLSPCTVTVQEGQSLEDILPWVAAEKTNSAVKKFTDKSEDDKKSEDDGSSSDNTAWDGVKVSSMNMPATGRFPTGIHLKKGQQVRVRADGSVNASGESTKSDAAYKWVGPDGWQSDPSFNAGRKGPLPAGSSFMALVGRITNGTPSVSDEKWSLIGSDQVLTASEDGELILVINDKVADSSGLHLDWLTNNQGGLKLKIQVK